MDVSSFFSGLCGGVVGTVITYPYNITLNRNHNVKIYNDTNIMNYSKILL